MGGPAPHCAPVDPTCAYYQVAVDGSPDAYATLCDFAMEAAASGLIPRREAYVAAECYARFAAAIGTSDHLRRLVSVLLTRAQEQASNGRSPSFFIDEAVHYLRILADEGDSKAVEHLEGLGAAAVWVADRASVGLRQSVEECYAEAARGDFDALYALFSATIGGSTHLTIAFEELVYAEHIARIGSFTNNPLMLQALAGVRLIRREYEQQRGGDLACAADAGIEASGLLLDLIAEGAAGLGAVFAELARSMQREEVAAVCANYPHALFYIASEGHA